MAMASAIGDSTIKTRFFRSQADLDVTERIYHCGELLGIHLLDHIIIGDHRYVSFREKGIFDEYT